MSTHGTGTVHSILVANHFLDMADEVDLIVRQMKLHKLVYYAHGWHMVMHDADLTSDKPQAWPYGPFYPELWEKTRKHGSGAVTERIAVGSHVRGRVSASQLKLLEQVFDAYGRFEDVQLMVMTHREGTPWHKVYKIDRAERAEIPRELIMEYLTALRDRSNSKSKVH